MSIAVQCPCGKTYQVPEDRLGRRFKCYLCNRNLIALVESKSQSSNDAFSALPNTSPAQPVTRPLYSDVEEDSEVQREARHALYLQKKNKLRVQLAMRNMGLGALICLAGLVFTVGLYFASGERIVIALGVTGVGAGWFLIGAAQLIGIQVEE